MDFYVCSPVLLIYDWTTLLIFTVDQDISLPQIGFPRNQVPSKGSLSKASENWDLDRVIKAKGATSQMGQTGTEQEKTDKKYS